MESFADHIKQIMHQRKLKASDVARFSGLSRSELHHILKRGRRPLPETMIKLAKGLRVDVEELMKAAGYLPEEQEPPTFALKVNERYIDVTDIPEETRRALEKIVEEIKRERRKEREGKLRDSTNTLRGDRDERKRESR